MEFELTDSLKSWYYQKIHYQEMSRTVRNLSTMFEGGASYKELWPVCEQAERDRYQKEDELKKAGLSSYFGTRKFLELESILIGIRAKIMSLALNPQ